MRTISLIIIFMITGCMATLPQGHIPPESKTYERTMDYWTEGFRRSYLVHVPPSYDMKNTLPLVVVVHGAFDTAKGMEKFSGFSDVADREGFVVMYPNGIGLFGFLQHWNAGHCCGKAADDGIDDIGFVAAAIEETCTRLNIDRDRVYMAGFSNGGMFTYRFAAERGDLLAAAAPLAGSIGGKASEDVPEWRPPDPVRALPMIIFHGLSDREVPYGGGISPNRGGPRVYLSVVESIQFWIRNNGCTPRPEKKNLLKDRIHFWQWKDCQTSSPVLLYAIENWGHDWPGKYYTSTLNRNDPLKNFDAAEIIWDFFKSVRRQP
ncbi:MAG: PHB depolymerase family esterase [Desulfobacterales bacterium]